MNGRLCRNCRTIWRRPRGDGSFSSVSSRAFPSLRLHNPKHYFHPCRWSSSSGSPGSPASIYDPGKPRWEDWFTSEEYDSPWDEATLEPLEDGPLDKASRYLIQSLQDLHHGLTGFDRPSTERCNRCINLLADPALAEGKLKGCAQRAGAILQHMELFYGLPKSGGRLAYPLPHPNYDTYFSVLKLYSQTKGLSAAQGPTRCLAIVERMQQRHDELGILDVKPNTVIWNQVLSAWAGSTEAEKAFHAAKLLQELQADGRVDSSSYGHVLRTCAFSNMNERAKRLGGEVALQVWKEFQQTDLQATSYMYTFLMQACINLDDAKRRDESVELAFLKCCQEGSLNAHVLLAFQQAASARLYRELMGALSEHRDRNPASLMQRVPPRWKRNANAKSGWGW